MGPAARTRVKLRAFVDASSSAVRRHSRPLAHSDDLSSERKSLCCPVSRERWPELILAFPVFDGRSGPREHDVFVLDTLGENLSGVEVLNDLAGDHRGEHEYANGRVCSVDDLMRTVLAPRKADDVTLLQRMLPFGSAQRGLATEHDHPFLVQVVRVVGPEPATRLDLGHGGADQLTADALADKRPLDAPALALP